MLLYCLRAKKAHKWRSDYPFVGSSERKFGSTQIEKLRNAITQNVIWADQETESFLYSCLPTDAMFDVQCSIRRHFKSAVNTSIEPIAKSHFCS